MKTPQLKYNLGDLIELKLDSISFGGEAVARLDGLVFFVEGGIDGERVLAEITQIKKKFLRARVKEILEPSSHRTQALCPVFGRCGGCQYQHIDYAHQLRVKENQVREIFERIGRLKNFKIDPIAGSPRPYGYRSRVDFHLLREEGKVQLGFVDRSNESVIDVDHCPISAPRINDIYQKIHEDAALLPEWAQVIKFWDTEEGAQYFCMSHHGKVDTHGVEFISLKVG